MEQETEKYHICAVKIPYNKKPKWKKTIIPNNISAIFSKVFYFVFCVIFTKNATTNILEIKHISQYNC